MKQFILGVMFGCVIIGGLWYTSKHNVDSFGYTERDERDLLSDAIRNYKDNNPNSDIMDYVYNYVGDSICLDNWVYAY